MAANWTASRTQYRKQSTPRLRRHSVLAPLLVKQTNIVLGVPGQPTPPPLRARAALWKTPGLKNLSPGLKKRPLLTVPRARKPLTEKLGRRKRRDIAVIRLEKALFPPQLPVSMRPVLPLGSAENWARSSAITVARRNTTRGTVPSLKETLKRTSNSLDNHANYYGK